MKKKLVSLMMAGVLSLGMVMSVSAAEDEPTIVPLSTNAVTKVTSGGMNGTMAIEFRATCVLESYSTSFAWTSSMTPESGKWMDSYHQSGEITFGDYSRESFSSSSNSYTMRRNKSMNGGYANMYAYSNAFGNAYARMTASL